MLEGSSRQVGLGIIGAGEVFQVCHGPCLLMMPHLFKMESICDISPSSTAHCAAKFHIPHSTNNPDEVLANPKVEVVMVLTSDDSHESLVVAALNAGKHVMVEKPITLSLPSAQAILAAESAQGGNRVFVGYMRRYAPSYLGAFKREMETIPKILYARVRDFSGPNANFTGQSGTFAIKPNDFPPGSGEEREERLERLFEAAFPGQVVTDKHRKYCRFLGSLASHDMSIMRETLGFPLSVEGVSVNDPFYTAILAYKNADGSPYSVTYESGIDKVPIFDAHLSVYGETKRVTIKYDSPYVKGLPIKVEVEEVNASGDVQRREMLSSYEDAYTAELQELHSWATTGKSTKTTAADAIQDLQIYDMMYNKWAKER